MENVKFLGEKFKEIRNATESLCRPLLIEDYGVQMAPDVSPPKWHLAHTTWFFEAFVLVPHVRDYQPFNPAYEFLFNSYYESQGPRWDRARRGLLFRPAVEEIFAYRRRVDEKIVTLCESVPEAIAGKMSQVLTLGLHHEQQHQELLVTDIKYNFACHPLKPAFLAGEEGAPGKRGVPADLPVPDALWLEFQGGVKELGHNGEGFSFDNERPRHKTFLRDYSIQNRLVTNGEYLEFINDGAYADPGLWLSEGWAHARAGNWQAPLYWEKQGEKWWTMTLHGFEPVKLNEPVCHVSYFEAEAFARWKGCRLPTEAEWENAARPQAPGPESPAGHFLDLNSLHPHALVTNGLGNGAADHGKNLKQIFGDVWEWTSSPYIPYPGFTPLPGGLGEYNGKFMCNQMVLRGGSCATPPGHFRLTYRNFFPPQARWQFSGIRLAADLAPESGGGGRRD